MSSEWKRGRELPRTRQRKGFRAIRRYQKLASLTPIPSQIDVDVCYIRDMDNSSIFRTSANVRESLFFHNRPETRMNTKRPFFDGISDGISGGETCGTQYSCGVHRLVDN